MMGSARRTAGIAAGVVASAMLVASLGPIAQADPVVAEQLRAKKPLRGITIALDPGHQ